MEPKFKVGDKAIIIQTNKICEIIELCDDTGCYKIKTISSNGVEYTAYYTEEQLKPVQESPKFKVGDTVHNTFGPDFTIKEMKYSNDFQWIYAGDYYWHDERYLEKAKNTQEKEIIYKPGDKFTLSNGWTYEVIQFINEHPNYNGYLVKSGHIEMFLDKNVIKQDLLTKENKPKFKVGDEIN